MEISPLPVRCSGQIHIVGSSRIEDRITVFVFLAKFWLPKGKLIFNSFNHKRLNSSPLSFMIKSLFVTFELSSWFILCKLIIYKPSLGKRDTKEPPLWWVLSAPALDIGLVVRHRRPQCDHSLNWRSHWQMGPQAQLNTMKSLMEK